MDKPIGVQIAESKAADAFNQRGDSSNRVVIKVAPATRDAVQALLYHDERFQGMGYTEFVLRAVAAADDLLKHDVFGPFMFKLVPEENKLETE